MQLQLAAEAVWGLVPRFIGLLYVIAFGGLIAQLEPAVGTRGILSIAGRLHAVRRDFPGLGRFFRYPTVFWFNSSDRAVRVVPWLGVSCGLLIIYGGPLSPWALALAWFLWLSLEPAGAIFPWDTMLQEVGFLALFLPTWPSLPTWEASVLPNPTVAFMFRWLVIRLMLGFGRLKFLGIKKADRLYMRGFFVWMPLPTSLGWYLHHAPRWFLQAMLVFMFAAEVVAPLLGLFPGPPRLISFVLLSSLMVGIQATGNWGYFNVGYLLLSVSLLDVHASIFDWAAEPWRSSLWHWPTACTNVLMSMMFLTSLLYLAIADSWAGRTFMHLDVDRWVWNRTWARALLHYLRAIAPLRAVNGYGVFHPHADPPLRVVPVYEGSRDGGATWRAYRYKYQPTRAVDRPPYVAPYQPRFDYAMYYAGLAALDFSFYSVYISDGTPYTAWARSSAVDRCAQRLLHNDPLMLRVFAENPFPEAPPDLIRVAAVAMTPASMATHRATGEWWHARRLGLLVPARGPEEWPDRYAIPVPELYHPDWVNFKRRAPALQTIVRAYQSGMAPDEAILQGSDLSSDEVRAFWDEFVPLLTTARGDFSRLKERADALQAQLGLDRIVRFERILERFAWLLRVRTERYQFADSKPTIALESTFRFQMFLHEAVTDGREAYLALLERPETAAARAERSSDELQLWAIAVMRYDIFMYHVCVFRWLKMLADAHEYKGPGIFEYIPLLVSIVPPDEVYRPRAELLPDGEHAVEGLYPPPTSPATTNPADSLT